METQMWEQFEAQFGTEPPLRRPDEVATAGRRTLRRRRVAYGAGALAVVAVGAVALGQLAGRPSASEGPAGQPSATAEPTPTSPLSTATHVERKLTLAVPVDTSWRQGCGAAGQPGCHELQGRLPLVGLRPDGDIARTWPGVIIAQRHDIDSGAAGPRYVVEARTATTHYMWFVLGRDARGAITVRRADPGFSMVDFETFADGLASGHPADGAPPMNRETNPYAG